MRISDWSSDVCSSDLVKHDHYGWPDAPRFAFSPVVDSGFVELPVTTARLFGRTLAAGGGGFFRLLPYAFSRWAVRQVNREEQRPAIIYFHPWEVDPEQPRVLDAPFKSKVRHYSRLRSEEHTSELQSLMRLSYAVFCFKKKNEKT